MDEQRLEAVIEAASRAPSVHNTQPWRFTVDNDVIAVHADRSRGLAVIDPAGRQLHLSCGAAIEYARLAVRSLGRACRVRLLPRAAEPDLLALLTIGPAEPPTREERQLFEAISARHTYRGTYDDRPLPRALHWRLRQAVDERGAWLRYLDRPGDRTALTLLLATAEDQLLGDPAYRQELAAWRRSGPARDGIPLGTLPPARPARVPDIPLRDFTGGGTGAPQVCEEPPPVERDTLLVLGTDGDEPMSWLRAGRALGRLLLVLTAEGLVAQPLGPVTDLVVSRARLRRELGLVGHPQLVLRVGYAASDGPPVVETGRRAREEALSAS
jgi:nitroreductase